MERIILGWSPEGNEDDFAISPRRFSHLHRLSPCQSGIVSYISRYYFEKNPWLLKQSGLLMKLLLEYGKSHRPIYNGLRKMLGLKPYLAPTSRPWSLERISVSTYCMINGIGPELLVPLKLVCDEPTEEGIKRALEIIKGLK